MFTNIIERLLNAFPDYGQPVICVFGYMLLVFTGLALLAAAGLKFVEHASNPQPLAKSRRHPFSTLGMSVCVAALFPFWYYGIGTVNRLDDAVTSYGCFVYGEDEWGRFCWVGLGLLMTLFAFVWHLRAKFNIRLMWSDGIEIKREHKLVTTGAYALARHPMYASLLMWCWGGSLMMLNFATLLIVTFVMLPLMCFRANAEEKELLAAHPDYALYQKNVRQLTPTLSGAVAMVIKIVVILFLAFWIFGYCFTSRFLRPSMIILLMFIHLYLGHALTPEKTAFSYRSKSWMMLVFWFVSIFWFPAFYFFWLILAMFVYGLKWNCPCMFLHEKYGGCPCWLWLRKKRACKIK